MDEQPQVTLSFTADAINLLLEGLAHLPIGRALPLFQELKNEAAKQLEPQKEKIDG